jgi:hypothetical protein
VGVGDRRDHHALPDDGFVRVLVGEAVEASAVGGKHSVYYIRHDMDADAVRAVRDAIVAEITQESKRIHEEILSGELGERALAYRAEEAEALRKKIALYEDLLDTGLEDLRQGLDLAEQGVAAAAIQGAGV